MSSDLYTILRALKQFVLCAVAVALVSTLLFIDIIWLHNAVKEVSLTEIAQETLLGLSALIFFRLAQRHPQWRYGFVLLGGFLLTMLIRELDGVFDLIVHGCWVYFALLVTVLCLLGAARNMASTLSGLACFVRSRSYGIMLCALLCILLFSRLMGMHQIWENVLLDGYVRTAKNVVEEGTELFGYTLCFIASLQFMRALARR
ncbi:hypothetical protein [Nissabacter sp. SGAir0207]|uniref:hypothetical protein n=1 Tax=Nissabacter sp. SGAir0207 TaxID=2126321 RepID=UPI0010CCBE67|nr:hypothetical protein [Nissabacter sp. SGAir0207]QCR36459.1 hypothetical protein C1N62_10280 [Nissabacter sp. SGAir0207]